MRRALLVTVLSMMVLMTASQALAQEATHSQAAAGAAVAAPMPVGKGLGILGVSVGAAIAVVGGALGIGLIGSRAPDAIARQPEAAGSIFLSWLLPAAMIEGATLFGILVCLLAMGKI